jgi:hypothetical protein
VENDPRPAATVQYFRRRAPDDVVVLADCYGCANFYGMMRRYRKFRFTDVAVSKKPAPMVLAGFDRAEREVSQAVTRADLPSSFLRVPK